MEANLHPEWTSKELSKKAPPKKEGNSPFKVYEKPFSCADRRDARPCLDAWLAMAVRPTLPTMRGLWPCNKAVLSLQHGCALFCLTSLGYSNFFKLLFIFKLTPRAFLSIKIRAFLLKVRQNTLEAQYE